MNIRKISNLSTVALHSCFVSIFLLLTMPAAQAASKPPENRLPEWVKKVGARSEPKGKRIFFADSYGAKGDGRTNSTKAIQKAIDEASKKGGIVAFKPGEYV